MTERGADVAANGVGLGPGVEVSADEYARDESLWDVAPFDETVCTGCGERVGAFLRADPDTGVERPTFWSFWLVPGGGVLCEDCYVEVLEEGSWRT